METQGSSTVAGSSLWPRTDSLISLGKPKTGGVPGGKSGNCTFGDVLDLLPASGRQKELLVRVGQRHQLQSIPGIISVRKGVPRWSPEPASQIEHVHHHGRAFGRE